MNPNKSDAGDGIKPRLIRNVRPITRGMPMNNYSAQFCEAFGESYAQIRDAYSDDEWVHVWLNGDSWNHLMLWNPYPPQAQPLLQLVATEMGLQYWNVGEPFRVDAAFVDSDRRVLGSVPFPLIAAIEHEHNVNRRETGA